MTEGPCVVKVIVDPKRQRENLKGASWGFKTICTMMVEAKKKQQQHNVSLEPIVLKHGRPVPAAGRRQPDSS